MAKENGKGGTFLLSDTNRVEVPFIKVTIGNYSFGAYDEKISIQLHTKDFLKKQEFNIQIIYKD